MNIQPGRVNIPPGGGVGKKKEDFREIFACGEVLFLFFFFFSICHWHVLNGITNIIIQKYISGGKLKPYCFHNDNYKMQSSTGSSWLVPLRLEGGNPHVRLSGGSHFLFSK